MHGFVQIQEEDDILSSLIYLFIYLGHVFVLCTMN